MSTIHVLPIADLIEHEVPGGWDGHGADCPDCLRGRWLCLAADEDAAEGDGDCPCRPEIEFVPSDDAPDGWLVTHHALDGREATEGRRAASDLIAEGSD